MKKIIKKTIFTFAIIITGLAIIKYYDHCQNYPGKYTFIEKKSGKTVVFEIGKFPKGCNKKYKLLGSHNTKQLLEMQKPKDLPNHLSWDNYNRDAYLDGRIHFNNDSSVVLITAERPRKIEEDENMIRLPIKKTNFIKNEIVLN